MSKLIDLTGLSKAIENIKVWVRNNFIAKESLKTINNQPLEGTGNFMISVNGVLSQRQVWTRAADNGYDYTIADIVRGEIPQANIDLLRVNGITLNEDSGYFECGALNDLSYNDAMNILAKTNAFAQGASAISGVQLGAIAYEPEKFRTNVPLLRNRWYMYSAGTFGFLCWNNQYIEILNLENNAGYVEVSENMHNAFKFCYRLKKIENVIEVRQVTGFENSFAECYSLESVKLKHIKKDISFSDSARLDYESIKFMIQNRSDNDNVPGEDITLILHATALANAEVAYQADEKQDKETYPKLADWALRKKKTNIATAQ